MRLIAKAEDREYEGTCYKCKALYAYTKSDIKVHVADLDDFNWLGMRKKKPIHVEDKYVICPSCGRRNWL